MNVQSVFQTVTLFLLCCFLSMPSTAKTFRCLLDGKTVFSDKPCPDSLGTVADDIAAKEKSAKQARESVAKQQESRSQAIDAEQETFMNKAIQASQCVTQAAPCSTSTLERYLKGLPIGWVEKALGPPQNEQRISGDVIYYWTLTLDEFGKKHTYRLQLQYGSGSECRTINGAGACVFNFYG